MISMKALKTEFICVSPKTSEAKEVFESYMYKLHSCKVKERKNGLMRLESISGKFFFWMNESDDMNWKIIK